MSVYVLPVLFALFVWWFSTGIIMYLDGLPRRTFNWSMIGATLMLGASLWGVYASRGDTSVKGAYCAFSCGLLAWGWQEISFYMGFVTGTRKDPCPEGCSGWRHFGHAIQTSLWHELAIIGSAAIVVALTWHSPNQVGTWTFMVLWWMHQSAKLNVFLGVRNLNEEFLPEHLQFLRSFLTKKPMNLLFPVSVTVSTVIAVHLVNMAGAHGADAFQRAGFTFLATMMVLAIVEHWLLVLPLPAAALWGWSLKSRGKIKPFEVEVVAGFLGAGKTTFLRNVLANAKPDLKTVVLVNDFASVGVDGSLLRERGADVVELPNGCICCSLKKDLAAQLTETVKKWSPGRVLIEPSGVADVAALMGVLSQPTLKPMIKKLQVSAVIDAGAFLRDFGRMKAYFEAQARVADVLVINKVDLVSRTERGMVETTLRALNPAARMVPAQYGIVMPGSVLGPVAASPTHDHAHTVEHANDHAHEHEHEHEHGHDDSHDHVQHDLVQRDHGAHDHAHGHAPGHKHHGDAPEFVSCTLTLDSECEPDRIQAVLEQICRGGFGQIERLKGIARGATGWMRFDVAGGRASMAAFAASEDEVPRVIAIGLDIDEAGLTDAFAACVRDEQMAA